MPRATRHTDPGFTLRVYTHLMPASEERTRNAIDGLFNHEKADVARCTLTP